MENFILFFQIPDEICDKLVDYHKNNEYDKNNSKYGWDVKTKESVDCTCYQRSNHPVIQEYLSFMYQGLQAYQQKYVYMNQLTVISQPFNIQYYPPGGGYKRWHNERSEHQTHQRNLVFMTYLNDVPDGGGTEFVYYPDVKINAKKGLSLLWPPDFTHTHRGIVSQHEKYIATGWFNHADVSEFRHFHRKPPPDLK